MTTLNEKRRLKAQAYKRLFLADDAEFNEAAKTVLDDLRRFCRANESTTVVSPSSAMIDPYASMVANGRREVILRIEQFLQMTSSQLTGMETRDNA